MAFKNLICRKKQENRSQQKQEEAEPESLSLDELNQLAMEATRSYEMLPLGGFPSGIWHFY